MKTCPKCAYSRKLSDQDKPDWQCPACGIVYAKVEDQPVAGARPAHVQRIAEGQDGISGKALFWFAAFLAAAVYVGYERMVKKPAAVAEKVASAERAGPGQRLNSETATELARLTPSKVVMFATDWCGYCAQARKLFKDQGVRYTEINVERDAEGARFQAEWLKAQGVPTIVIGNRLIHGYDEGQILAGLGSL